MVIEPCREFIGRYLEVVFSYCEGFIPLRAFSERHKDNGEKPHAIWIENNGDSLEKTMNFARWAHDHGMACYCIPGTVAEEKQASAVDIRQMQVLLIDIDNGDTDIKLEQAILRIGQPTLVVESGGVTETGQFKLHLYWQLSEPAEGEDLAKLMQLRHTLALVLGGDTHFKSAHQPIRIAGSVYHKSAEPREVHIRSSHHVEYHLNDLWESLVDELPLTTGAAPGMLDFNQAADPIITLLTRQVHAGGIDGTTRFEALSRVIGYWLHCYHQGWIPHEEAWEYIQGYNAACVVPPWEEARLKEETNRLWKKHLARRGQPIPQAPAADPLQSYTLQALLADRSPMPDDVIAPRILTPGGLMVFAGAPKVGKSDFLLTLFAHLSAGVPFLGFVPPRPMRVFYLQAEVQYDYLRERLQSMQLPPEIVARAARNLITTPQVRLILDEKGVQRVITHIGNAFDDLPPDIIAVDPIRNVFDGGNDGGENDNSAMLVFLQERVEVLRAAINPKAGVILVHHTRKVSKKQFEEDPFQSLSGASSLRGFYTTGIILYRPDEALGELHMLFELRNGASLTTKIVEKVNGQWIETDPHRQRLVLQNYGQKLDAERIRKREVIVELLYEQAKLGKFFNPTQFAEVFENTHGLGATDTILKRISVNATKGYIKYCRDAEKYGLPKAVRSKYGYLCVEGMQQGAGDDAPAIYPTHYKHAETGVLLEVENPQIWVYAEEENA